MNVLAAAVIALLAASPFPAPKLAQVTEKTKCDWGPIASISADGNTMVLTTPAGPVTYQVGLGVQVFAADGKPMGTVTSLRSGQGVRVYYVIDNGAKAIEIDLE